MQSAQEIVDYFSADRIKCLVCGGRYLQLTPGHLARHDLDMDQYRAAYGLPDAQPLCCPTSSARKRDNSSVTIVAYNRSLTEDGRKRLADGAKARGLWHAGHKARNSSKRDAEIRRLKAKGFLGKKLAEMYAISDARVSQICSIPGER